MVTRIAVLLVALAATAALKAHLKARRKKTKCQLTPEDYSVYAALVEGLGGPEAAEESWKGKQVFVADVTGADRDPTEPLGNVGLPFPLQCGPKSRDRA
jgi:hypothetical protein